jgi:hypothetical protein
MRVGALLFAFGLSACASSHVLNAVPAGESGAAVAALPGSRTSNAAAIGQQSDRPSATHKQTLFVINASSRSDTGTLTTYQVPSPSVAQHFNLDSPVSIAAGGRFVYVSSYVSQRVLAFYRNSSGLFTRLKAIRVQKPTQVAADSKGDLFVNSTKTSAGAILFFPPGATKPSRTITTGISGPQALACDQSGDLFVLNSEPKSVTVYAPGSGQPRLKITKGLHLPYSMAIDGSGNIYVGNITDQSSVVVYASGKSSPQRFIRTGISQPIALAFDKAGDLYVSNQLVYATHRSSITAYAPGASSPMLTIDGAGCPTGDCNVKSLAFDSADRLYVPNNPVNMGPPVPGIVSVFKPGQTVASQTITDGIDGPAELVISK